jgi:hypothetical protein
MGLRKFFELFQKINGDEICAIFPGIEQILKACDVFYTIFCQHRLNMELDLGNFILAPCAQLHSLAKTPQPPPHPPPASGLIDEGAIGQPRWTTSLCDPLVVIVALFQYYLCSYVFFPSFTFKNLSVSLPFLLS